MPDIFASSPGFELAFDMNINLSTLSMIAIAGLFLFHHNCNANSTI
ncbi:MAG: hypothetical protein V7K64_28825 [Nostoc sp.]|nr:hypothetical protein [Nostoc sp. JL34]MBN3887340.1 hypothetical protein [Nostoc sp. JL34]